MSVFEQLYYGDVLLLATAYTVAAITVVILAAACIAARVSRTRAAKRHAVWLACLACVAASPLVAGGVTAFDVRLLPSSWAVSRPLATAELAAAHAAADHDRSPMTGRETRAIESMPAPALDQSEVTRQSYGASNEPDHARDAAVAPPSSVGDESFWKPLVVGCAAVWLAGAAILLARLMGGVVLLGSVRRAARPIESVVLARVAGDVARRVGRQGLPPILVSPRVASPVVLGLARPAIVLSDSFLQTASHAALVQVLVHECAHVARGDQWIALLARLTEIIYWPHPLVWWANRRLAEAREDVCDNYVLKHEDAAKYASTLLQLAEQRLAKPRLIAALAIDSDAGTLADRVSGILDARRELSTKTPLVPVWTLASLLMGLTLAVCGLRPASAEPSDAQTPTAALATTGAKPDDAPDTIRGVVVDEQGRGVAGAIVRRHGSRDELVVTTAADGSFAIPNFIGASGWSLIAEATDGALLAYATDTGDAAPGQPGSTRDARLVLKPARRVAVQVEDAAQRPIAGAIVEILAEVRSFATANTDARGSCSFEIPDDLPVRWITALKDGVGFDYYENYSSSTQLSPRALGDAVRLKLDGAIPPTTVAVKDTGGQPVAGASVFPWIVAKAGKIADVNLSAAGSTAQTTNASGECAFKWLPTDLAERVAVLPRHDDWRFQRSPSDVLDLDTPSRTLSLTALRPATLRGALRFADGTPAKHILVQAQGRAARISGKLPTMDTSRGFARTDELGRYSIQAAPFLVYAVGIVDADRAAASKAWITTEEGKTIDGLDFTLTRGTVIHGRLSRGEAKAPLPNARVRAIEWIDGPARRALGLSNRLSLLRGTTTDDEGRYEMRVGPGKYELRLGDDSGQPIELVVGNQPEIEHSTSVAAPQTRALAGRIVRADTSEPVSVAEVWLVSNLSLGSIPTHVTTDDDGMFHVDLPEGPYVAIARDASGSLSGFTAVGARDRETELALHASATLKARLYYGGAVLKSKFLDLHVSVPGMAGDLESGIYLRLNTTTDDEGLCLVTGLPVGAQCRFHYIDWQRPNSVYSAVAPIHMPSVVDVGDVSFR